MRLDIHQLQGSTQSGARATVAALVRQAEEELKHLEAGGEDAIHDFRVALRRLRSVARALRPYLGSSLRKRHEKRLRAVARATAEARDAEVQLAWLEQERERAGPRVAPAIDLLVRHLETRQRESLERGSQARVASFHRLARRLAARLAGPAPEPGGAAPPFAAALAGLIRERVAELVEALEAVGGPFEVEQGHSARIAAKRLRYLLEPLRGNPRADASAAVDALKELQDLLGELHDAHVAGDTIAAALAEAASERARQAHEAILAGDPGARALRLARRDLTTRGLLELDRLAADRAGAAYERLVREWIPARKVALTEAVAQVAGALAPHASGRPPAPRRYLLVRLPEGAGGAPPLQIETGWMRGAPPRTWLRRVRGPDGVRYFRGEEREDSTPEEIAEGAFLALWPSTEGRRLVKRRTLLVEKGQAWSLDELPDLRMALAESAVPPGTVPRMPRALRSLVVREVTGERAYAEERLAARTRASRTSVSAV